MFSADLRACISQTFFETLWRLKSTLLYWFLRLSYNWNIKLHLRLLIWLLVHVFKRHLSAIWRQNELRDWKHHVGIVVLLEEITEINLMSNQSQHNPSFLISCSISKLTSSHQAYELVFDSKNKLDSQLQTWVVMLLIYNKTTGFVLIATSNEKSQRTVTMLCDFKFLVGIWPIPTKNHVFFYVGSGESPSCVHRDFHRRWEVVNEASDGTSDWTSDGPL